jgi:hypothetical protein
MCSLSGAEAGEMCSPADADTRGDCRVDVEGKIGKAVKRLKIKAFRPKVAFCSATFGLSFLCRWKAIHGTKNEDVLVIENGEVLM